jgi:hypothetical protein
LNTRSNISIWGVFKTNTKLLLFLVAAMTFLGSFSKPHKKQILIQASDQELSAVVHPELNVSNMTMKELKQIFKADKQYWSDNRRIIIALMKTDTEIGGKTASNIYGCTGPELRKFWLSITFQGRADPPHFFQTEEELRDFVSKNKGAIGILGSKTEAKPAKRLTVDGAAGF